MKKRRWKGLGVINGRKQERIKEINSSNTTTKIMIMFNMFSVCCQQRKREMNE